MKAQARKVGGSLYIKIDPYYRERIRAGDWIDYDIRSIEPPTTAIDASGSDKVSPAFTEYSFPYSWLYGLANASVRCGRTGGMSY